MSFYFDPHEMQMCWWLPSLAAMKLTDTDRSAMTAGFASANMPRCRAID
jgi:hypothetical protein